MYNFNPEDEEEEFFFESKITFELSQLKFNLALNTWTPNDFVQNRYSMTNSAAMYHIAPTSVINS